MAGPSVTYTFTNGTVADASQINQNMTDLINGMTDGTKDFNINALTAAGTATLNGDTIIGNASGDASTVNATMSFATTPKTDAIAEKTGAAGVTIDGLLLKDGGITGRTSGSVGAGFVGQVLGPTSSSTFTPGAGSYTASGGTVTLTTGFWLLFGEFYSETTGATEERGALAEDGSAGSSGLIAPSFFGYIKGSSTNGNVTAIPVTYYVVTAATQVIYGKAIAVSGTPAAGAKFVVTAVRII